MTRNFRMTIEYDGTGYHGWQIQPNQKTIQGEIEKVLQIITRQEIRIIGSGRTDAGVHALGQTANFACHTRLDAKALHRGLNSLLPKDIVIKEFDEIAKDFHARFDVKSKRYQYRIINDTLRHALFHQYAWYIKRPLDVRMMEQAASFILGEHDFSSFEGTGSPRNHNIRTVFEACFYKNDPGYLYFEIEANGFLKFMVRNIVGTLIDVGLHKTTLAQFKHIFLSKDRNLAGMTAPAQGLFLLYVNY